MAEEWEKYAVLKNMFRRKSSTEFAGGEFKQLVDEKQMSNLLDEMGAHVDQKTLHQQVEQISGSPEGKLNFEQYTKLCDTFVKDPTATTTAMEFKSFNDFNE